MRLTRNPRVQDPDHRVSDLGAYVCDSKESSVFLIHSLSLSHFVSVFIFVFFFFSLSLSLSLSLVLSLRLYIYIYLSLYLAPLVFLSTLLLPSPPTFLPPFVI